MARGLGRDQILWTIGTAVGMPNRTMDLPYLKRSMATHGWANNRRGSDLLVG
jgi:hypothetical protein